MCGFGWAIGLAFSSLTKNVWLGQTDEAWVLHFNTKSGLKARHNGYATILGDDTDKIQFKKIQEFQELDEGIVLGEEKLYYTIGILVDYEMGFIQFFKKEDGQFFSLYKFDKIDFQNKPISPCFKLDYEKKSLTFLKKFKILYNRGIPCYHGYKMYLDSGLNVPEELQMY